jgi:16S rRNA A1518/A1519 N6-dimethyltransferase RsmA/KsgA/DIM1 with predicted DNA glycosylase/AP lyase activity
MTIPLNKMLQAKKKFSQNFLVDQNLRDKVLVIMSKIVGLRPELELVEIGPGAGDLTKLVVNWKGFYKKYTALEIDPDAIEFLKSLELNNENYPNFELVYCDAWKSLLKSYLNGHLNQTVILSTAKDLVLIEGKTSTVIQSEVGTSHPFPKGSKSKTLGDSDEDVIKEISLRLAHPSSGRESQLEAYPQKTKFANYIYPSRFNLISSLPYAIGSRIMVDLGVINPTTNFAVILQKEVATKCIPTPKNFNFFGAWLNLLWTTKVELILPPHAFSPQPKVHSAVLTGIYHENKILGELLQTQESRQNTKNTLKTLFSQPSKTLYNNLRKLDWSKDRIEEFYRINDLDKNLRLGWENYEELLEKVMRD